ncbi:MAG: aspartate-semialdehyde dehydrogenase [Clostridia bacterium]|nr:aspartate-semialdehyde dehydrogenase [Clostridia bacterium]
MRKRYAIAIVGATGLIGRNFLRIIEKSDLPVDRIELFASDKSEGKKLKFRGQNEIVKKLDENCFKGLDFVFFSAGKEVALKYAPIAEKEGATVIDNSSAFRSFPDIPLIIPEINFDEIYKTERKIIANPNCSTIQAILPLTKLNEKYGLKRLIITTYQAVSGCGQKGINDLTECRLGKKQKFFSINIAENCICKIGEVEKDGYTDEEKKAYYETRKIFGKDISVSATCVRVPIENCHGVSVEAQFETDPDIEDAIEKISQTEGVKLKNLPYQKYASGRNEVFVGRIRKSAAFENGIAYYCVADNTLRGAAYNAVKIAMKIIGNLKN